MSDLRKKLNETKEKRQQQVSIKLTDEQYEKLFKYCQSKDMSLSRLCRQIVVEFLDKV